MHAQDLCHYCYEYAVQISYIAMEIDGTQGSVLANSNSTAGADPEILHGRWLMGWLPIVNYTGAMGVAG